jgi:hypothetical protein
MKIGKLIAGFVLSGAVMASVAPAHASTSGNVLTLYPGTACNAFGNASVGPNGGAEIVDWSSTSAALVDCPFTMDPGAGTIEDYVYLTKRGTMSCTLRAQSRSGPGWVWAPIQENFNGGLDELVWNAEGEGGYTAAAIECVLQPWATLNSYRVMTLATLN